MPPSQCIFAAVYIVYKVFRRAATYSRHIAVQGKVFGLELPDRVHVPDNFWGKNRPSRKKTHVNVDRAGDGMNGMARQNRPQAQHGPLSHPSLPLPHNLLQRLNFTLQQLYMQRSDVRCYSAGVVFAYLSLFTPTSAATHPLSEIALFIHLRLLTTYLIMVKTLWKNSKKKERRSQCLPFVRGLAATAPATMERLVVEDLEEPLAYIL